MKSTVFRNIGTLFMALAFSLTFGLAFALFAQTESPTKPEEPTRSAGPAETSPLKESESSEKTEVPPNPKFPAELLAEGVQLVRSGACEQALEVFLKMETESILTQPQTLAECALAANYWFYRAAAEHQTFQKDACVQSLDHLEALARSYSNSDAESTDDESWTFTVPARFSSLARLMRKDLDALQDESLEMISRRMRNVEQRLASGSAGKKVQESEEEILEMLDSTIEDLEQQAQKQKSLSNRSLKPGKPMSEAKIAGGKGPGNVSPRELKFEGNWGALPEKKREEVLQQLGKDFPPHYRDAIEQYFRRMAEQE